VPPPAGWPAGSGRTQSSIEAMQVSRRQGLRLQLPSTPQPAPLAKTTRREQCGNDHPAQACPVWDAAKGAASAGTALSKRRGRRGWASLSVRLMGLRISQGSVGLEAPSGGSRETTTAPRTGIPPRLEVPGTHLTRAKKHNRMKALRMSESDLCLIRLTIKCRHTSVAS
jgi:hypothetical protein